MSDENKTDQTQVQPSTDASTPAQAPSEAKSKRPLVYASASVPLPQAHEHGLIKSEGNNDLGYIFQHHEEKKKNPIIAPRLSITEDLFVTNNYSGVFKQKPNLLPSWSLKQMRIYNQLVANILRNRGNMLSAHGHIRRDRFDIGIEIIIKPEFESVIKPEQMTKIRDRISRFESILMNCGHVEGLASQEKMTLPVFMSLQTQNALTFGWHATEIIYSVDEKGNKKFNRFRPVDSGTIRIVDRENQKEAGGIRKETISEIKQSLDKANVPYDKELLDSFIEKDYAWAQVVGELPKRAFTSEELLVDNYYPSTDIEHRGYPVTPMDTCLNSVISLMHISTWNRLFFQNGRAAKGMLVITREGGLDQQEIEMIRQDFQASITGTQNAFRIPLFGMDKEEDVKWVPVVSSTGDGEFQALFDQTCRDVLSAFGMSPDEISGYGHLSRGSNQQTLSECFPLENQLLTDKGSFPVADLLKDSNEAPVTVWTGKNWEKGRVFRTGTKKMVETVLSNGLSLKTSPDHRFLVVEGIDLLWVQQKDLKTGDLIAVDKGVVSEEIRDSKNPLEDYNFSTVCELIDHDQIVEMADVEVFNSEHAFSLGGIIVHNSNNEFKLTAIRDSGLRPIILRWQAFFNEEIFPIIDPELSKICSIQLSGLDAKTREQEAAELTQNAPLFLTYDDILKQVDKEPVGTFLGGDVPFNERYRLVSDAYLTVGQFKDAFMNDPTALVDISQEFYRDQFWQQNFQALAQTNPAAVMARTQTPEYYKDMLDMLLNDWIEEN